MGGSLLLRSAGGRGETRGMLPTLDLRFEYLIDGVLLAHACTSTNRGCAFHETLLVDDTGRIPSFVFPFSNIRGASYFSKRDAIAS